MGSCYCCGSEHALEMHHVRPRRAGGCDANHNVVPLCRMCHSLIDRVPLAQWPLDFYAESTTVSWPPVMKRLLLKLTALAYDAEGVPEKMR